MRAPVHGVVQGEAERAALLNVIDKQWYTHSVYTAEFEKLIRQYIGVRHAAFCNSGSSANLLALSTLADYEIPEERRIMPGDEVITTAISFVTTVAPIVQVGAIPVFIDMRPDFTVDIDAIDAVIKPKTKAVVLTHTLGVPFDGRAVRDLCDRRKLWLIEDSCDALGSSHSGRMCGAWGDLSTLSFYPAHTITAGEGGMVLTDNPDLMKIVRSLRDWGRGCWCKPGQDNACGKRFDNGYDHKHTHVRMGYNLKATDLQAAIGVAQMSRLRGFVDKRRTNYQYLQWKLSGGQHDVIPLAEGAVPFGFPLLLNGVDRAKFCRYLENNGVGVRMIFGGLPDQHPAYQHITYRVSGELPNTKEFYERGCWVGCWPGLDTAHLDHIVNTIEEYDTCKSEITSS